MSGGLLALIFFGTFFIFLFIGVPITFSLGAGGVASLLASGMKMSLVMKSSLSVFDSFTMLAIFLFTMMGVIYQKTGLASLLTDALKPGIGRRKGGLALVVTYASAIFGALTGSANATCATFSKLFGKEMVENGYPKDWTAATIAAASPLGQLIPPSVTCIVLGVSMGLSISSLFIVDLAMGLATILGLTVVILIIARMRNYGGSDRVYTKQERRKATLKMLPLLSVPLLVIGGMYAGWFTPTEAGAIGAAFSFLLGMAYKRLSWKLFYQIVIDACKTTAIVLLLCAASYIISDVMSMTGITKFFTEFLVQISGSGAIWGMLFLFLVLLVMGCFIDLIVLCIILAPTAAAALAPFGVNPYHIAAIFLIGNLIGIVTPPVGVALFISSSSLKVKMEQISKQILPFIGMYIVLTLIFIFIPESTLWLAQMLGMKLG
ncbi:MAG: TRAP transporter large permease [Alphaproteobacteria bacterium]|nr:TRAP transporter large permease [Alphaproteobacteria bacterium]